MVSSGGPRRPPSGGRGQAGGDGDGDGSEATIIGAEHTTFPKGSVLSHTYEIESLMARGGMGEVYRARHVELGTEHAIKIILPELANNTKVVDLFRREAAILRNVRDDAVVGYDGVFRDENGRVYLVMEFVDGPSLKQELRKGALRPDQVRLLRDRLARGLAAAHEKGVIHRDISPDNVILEGGRLDKAKIIDFGIAKLEDPETSTIIGGDFAGKYSYASPEQLGMYGGDVGPQSDMYSLGLVLAAAASGRQLDMGKSTISVVEARKKVPDLSGVPTELRDELDAMLQPDPKDRPRSMRDLIPDEHEQARGGRRFGLWIGAAGFVAAAAAAVVVAWPAIVELLGLQPEVPPAATPAALRAAVESIATDFSCADLETRVGEDRYLTITGHVGSSQDLLRLQTQLLGVTGLSGIDNAVEVQPCPDRDVEAIRTALTGIAAGFDCAELSMEVTDEGRVAAFGHVGSRDDFRRLQEELRAVPGVTGVDNAVAVQPCPTPVDGETIRTAMAATVGSLECADVSAELTADHRITVTGTIGSDEDRRSLERRLAAIDGVAGVDMRAALQPCPPPVDPAVVRAAVDRIVAGFDDCADLAAQVDGDLDVTVTGRLGSRDDVLRLRRELEGIEGIGAVREAVSIQPCPTGPRNGPDDGPDDGPAQRLMAEAERVTGRFSCAELSVDVANGNTIRVAGLVASERDRDRLREQLAALPDVSGVNAAVDIRPWPFCEFVPIAAAIAAPPGDAPAVRPNQADGIYRPGDEISFEVTATGRFDGYLYVDYIDSDGNIVHLLPTPERPDNAVAAGETVTIGRPPHRTYTARPPFGPIMILAVSTRQPLFRPDRPMVEAASQYVDTLRHALRTLDRRSDDSGAVAGYIMLAVEPR